MIRSVLEPADLLDLIRARVPGFRYILGCIVLLPITLRVSKLDRPRVEERAGGYGDVIFGRVPESSDNSSDNKDPAARARLSVGFKALSNAEEVRVRLEQWIAGELEEAANAVSDFLEAQHGMNGSVVTRRSTLQSNASTGTVGAASVVTVFRYVVLHDGRYHVMVLSKWPERSAELTSAVNSVVRSLRVAP